MHLVSVFKIALLHTSATTGSATRPVKLLLVVVFSAKVINHYSIVNIVNYLRISMFLKLVVGQVNCHTVVSKRPRDKHKI